MPRQLIVLNRRHHVPEGTFDAQARFGRHSPEIGIVAQRVDVGGFAHAALLQGAAKGPLQSAAGDRATIGLHAVFESVPGHRWEQPSGRAVQGPKFP